jgi:acyltransferase
MDFNLTLWFWTCLFVVNIMFYFLKKKIRTKAQLITILILFSLAGYAEGLWNPYRLPWGIDIALSAIVFFGFGHILSSLLQSLLLKRVAVKTILIGLFFIPNLVLSDPLMNLNMKLHASYFDFYVEAFSGITFCILLSSIIHSKWLLYLGRNSLILTAAHIPMLKISKQLLVYAGFVSNHYAIEIVRAILTILLTLPLIYITQRFFPSIIGNSRRIPNQGAHLEPNLSLAGDSRR